MIERFTNGQKTINLQEKNVNNKDNPGKKADEERQRTNECVVLHEKAVNDAVNVRRYNPELTILATMPALAATPTSKTTMKITLFC